MKADLLAARPRSRWASDVPPDAFPEECEELVTGCSNVDLYCLRRLAKNGRLQEVSEAPKVDSSVLPGRDTCHADQVPLCVLLVEAGACGVRGVDYKQRGG